MSEALANSLAFLLIGFAIPIAFMIAVEFQLWLARRRHRNS